MKAGLTTSPADPPVTASRRRILARTRLDFWLDALLLVAYTLAYSLGFTGVATHEWLGIGLGVILLVHLTLHWDWVIRTTRKLLRPGGRERFIWLVNLLLLVSMTLCIASGILISEVALPQLGDQPSGQLLLAADARHHGHADADPGARPRRAALAVDRGRGPPFRRLASGAIAVKFVRQLIDPTIQILRPIPITAWLPLAMIIFGLGPRSAFFLVFLGAFYPILVNTIFGVRSVEPRLFEAAARPSPE